MSVGFDEGVVQEDEKTPIAAIALMAGGGAHVVSSIAHAGLFTLGFGFAMLDPEIDASDPTFLGIMGGALGCLLLPDVISLFVGSTMGLFGYRAHQRGVSSVAVGAALLGAIWAGVRVLLDFMTCQCSTLFLYMLPGVVSLIALVFATRRE